MWVFLGSVCDECLLRVWGDFKGSRRIECDGERKFAQEFERNKEEIEHLHERF